MGGLIGSAALPILPSPLGPGGVVTIRTCRAEDRVLTDALGRRPEPLAVLPRAFGIAVWRSAMAGCRRDATPRVRGSRVKCDFQLLALPSPAQESAKRHALRYPGADSGTRPAGHGQPRHSYGGKGGGAAERLELARVQNTERSEVTSGNIQMGPDPDQVLAALKKALRDDPGVRGRPAEEVSRDLALGGYLREEPDPVLVAEMLGELGAEGWDDEATEEASPT